MPRRRTLLLAAMPRRRTLLLAATPRRRTLLLAATAAAAPLIAGLLATPAALADEIPSTSRVVMAKLKDGGERVRVELAVTCPAGATVLTTVTVTQANATRIAQGTATADAACTGSEQQIILRPRAERVGALFIKGPATSRTVRTVCDGGGCSVIPFDETIRIKD
jgi:hypothetical protein